MRSFTEKEKEYYTQELLKKGRSVFARYGVKKTTIEELTRAVGIAKGSFYLFFESKEELFFRILKDEVRICREENLRRVEAQRGNPYHMVKEFLQTLLYDVTENPIVSIAVSEEGRELMAREAISHEIKYGGEMKAGLDGVVFTWIRDGVIANNDVEAAANMIRSLFVLAENRDKFAEGQFDKAMALLVDFMARGLTDTHLASEQI